MRHTVLYIDPDAATRLLVQKVLAVDGFHVLEATTAIEGQQLAATTLPELALIDVDRVRAADLVAALRGSPELERVRLLASTAHAWPNHVETMLTLGFDRVVLQPFDIDDLPRQLTNVLDAAGLNGGDRAVAIEDSSPMTVPPTDLLVETLTGVVAGNGHASVDAAEEVEVAEAERHDEVPDAVDAAEEVEVAEAERHDEVPDAVDTPVVTLEPVEVPRLWRRALAPFTVNLVRSTASTDCVLALLDDGVLVIVATASSRHLGNGGAVGARGSTGTRALLRTIPWLRSVIANRDTLMIGTDSIAPSPLVPAGSHSLLVLPVTSRDKVHGVAVLGKHRSARVPAYSPGKVARSLAQAEQIGGIVEMLRELDRASVEKRRELERQRLDGTRALLAEMIASAKPSRRGGSGRERGPLEPVVQGDERERAIRLADRLAEWLRVSPRQREVLRQALEVWDIGKAWVEHVLFARGTFSVGGRERLLDAYAEQGAEILKALDWPPAVVELVSLHQAEWSGGGHPTGLAGTEIPLPARIMSVVTAFASLTAGHAPDEGPAAVQDALAEVSRQAGIRYDPDVVEALIGLCLSTDYYDLDQR